MHQCTEGVYWAVACLAWGESEQCIPCFAHDIGIDPKGLRWCALLWVPTVVDDLCDATRFSQSLHVHLRHVVAVFYVLQTKICASIFVCVGGHSQDMSTEPVLWYSQKNGFVIPCVCESICVNP